jgi:uncharacterized protein (TIGR00369 family)
MRMLGAQLERVAAGEVEISLPFRTELTQQHGALHAGVVTALADTACGYAALTLMPAGVAVVSVEFKINLIQPAVGPTLVARGSVVRSGRTLTVCSGEVITTAPADERVVATMLATMMAIRGRPDRND